jgi:hypothetical protein
MIPNNPDLQLRYTGDQIMDLYTLLDDLHSAASEGQIQAYTTLGEGDLLSLLHEMVYTAQETIYEIEKNRGPKSSATPSRPESFLRVLPPPEKKQA